MPSISPTRSEIVSWCIDYLSGVLKTPNLSITPASSFSELGVDSVLAVHMATDLGDWLDLVLEPEVIYDHPSVAELSEYLARHLAQLGRSG
jgi:acyl carrier protein